MIPVGPELVLFLRLMPKLPNFGKGIFGTVDCGLLGNENGELGEPANELGEAGLLERLEEVNGDVVLTDEVDDLGLKLDGENILLVEPVDLELFDELVLLVDFDENILVVLLDENIELLDFVEPIDWELFDELVLLVDFCDIIEVWGDLTEVEFLVL